MQNCPKDCNSSPWCRTQLRMSTVVLGIAIKWKPKDSKEVLLWGTRCSMKQNSPSRKSSVKVKLASASERLTHCAWLKYTVSFMQPRNLATVTWILPYPQNGPTPLLKQGNREKGAQDHVQAILKISKARRFITFQYSLWHCSVNPTSKKKKYSTSGCSGETSYTSLCAHCLLSGY